MGIISYELDRLEEFLLEKRKSYKLILAQSPPGTLQVLREGNHYNYVHSLRSDSEALGSYMTGPAVPDSFGPARPDAGRSGSNGTKLNGTNPNRPDANKHDVMPPGLNCPDIGRSGSNRTYLNRPDANDHNALHSGSNCPGSDTDTRRKYIRRGITKDESLIRALADKEYARCALNIIETDLSLLKKLRPKLKALDPVAIRASMKHAYRSLPEDWIREVHLPKERMKEHEIWASQPYEISDNKPHLRNKKTSRGLYVRTKAEVLIAEMLYHYEVPFRYEQVIHIGRYKLAPDFTFQDSSRQEFYWEYCGMMDDPDYLKGYLWKRNLYESVGICQWTSMIYTFDKNNDIDMHQIEQIIQENILPRL